MPVGYKFSDLIKDNNSKDYTVLLDVPQQLAKAYQANRTPETLAAILNHKYYVTTISNSRAAKIASLVDNAAGNLDAELTAFDPAIIVNYPGAQTIKQAKIEWQQKHADAHAKLTGNVEKPVEKKPEQTTTDIKPTDDVDTATHKVVQQSTSNPHSVDANVTTPQTTVKATHDSLQSIARQFKSTDPARKTLDKAIELLALLHKAPNIK